MMSAPYWLLALLAFAVVLLAGAALLRLLLREEIVGTPLLERCGLSWVLGTGYVSVGLFVVGWAVRGGALVALISVGAIALAYFASRLTPPVRFRWRRPTV